MNSAAKLRTRTIAGLGASALLATAFGPAALAWEAAPVPTDSAAGAGAASFGIIDSDDNTAGTQGAQAVSPGVNDQAIAAMRFVVPATWKSGDKLVFSLTQQGDAATKTSERMSFAGTPSVAIDSKAYAASTYIAGLSLKTSGNTALTGDVEGGGEKAYTVPVNGVAPVAPQFTVSMGSSLNNPAFQDQIILTFSNSNDTGAATAKYIGSLNDVKINVGTGVKAGNVVVSAKALDAADATSAEGKEIFFNGSSDIGGGSEAKGAKAKLSSTIPAVIINGSLSVANSALTADGSAQFTGPITVTKTDGAFTGDVKVKITNGTIESTNIKVKRYDSAGSVVGADADAVIGDGKTSLTWTRADTTTARIEFTGVAVAVTAGTKEVKYALESTGGITVPVGPLALSGGGPHPLNQTDIAAPASVAEVKVRPGGQGSDSRVSGLDRYSTAARLAAANLADTVTRDDNGSPTATVLGVTRKQNSVVLVSGTSFADALSAGYLAKVTSSRILLTEPDALPGATSDFIRDYGVKDVYIVGGTSAVSSALEASLRNRLVTNANEVGPDVATPSATQSENQKLNVVRISGPDRFVTNRNVNRYAYEKASGVIGSMVPAYGSAKKPTAVFVSGTTPWDALAASPMVSRAVPVVLTTPGLHDQAKGQIGDFGIGYGIVVGGESVISGAAEADLKGRGLATFRVAGENRFATANAVNDLLLKPTAVTSATTGPQGFGFQAAAKPFLVNGGVVAGAPDATKWADALAVGPIAAAAGPATATARPILLTDSASLPGALETWLKAHTGLGAATAVGGPDVVSNAVLAAANTILGD